MILRMTIDVVLAHYSLIGAQKYIFFCTLPKKMSKTFTEMLIFHIE